MAPLTSERLEVGEYARFLSAFLGFYEAIEPTLVTTATRLGRSDLYPRCLRREWLRRDLGHLGQIVENSSEFPRHFVPVAQQDAAEFAGHLYVIEGSALGGRHLARAVVNSAPRLSMDASRYLAGFAEETESRWARTCEFLEVACASDENRNRAATTAIQTFNSLATWMDDAVNALELDANPLGSH